jgi:heptosyltransferase II
MCPKNIKDLDIKKILVIGLSCLGDNLLLTPSIAKIRDTFKNAEMDIIIGQRGYEFAQDNPWFKRCIVFDKHKNIFRFIGMVNQNRYDLIVDFRNSLLPFFLRGKYKLNFYKQELFSEKNFTHESKRILDFLAPYFGKEKEIHLYFPVGKKEQDVIEERLRHLGVKNSDIRIVLNPGAGGSGKQWAKENFVDLAKELLKTYVDIKIFLTGTDGQKQLCGEVENSINSKNVYNLSGKTTLKELAALLEKTDLIITNDSGTLHMASAVRCPVVAIFGPTNPYRYGPIGTRNIVVHSDLDCFPCKNRKQCRKDFLCLKKISVEQVLRAAMLILDEKEQPLLFDL